ncbi:MAG: hypothetical protein WCL21_19785 [Mariniphaga sp.]
MIIAQSHTTANLPEACFQPTVFQCDFMINACYDAPHFGENLNSVVGKHSEPSERYISVDGKHSEPSERYFSVDGKHSEPSERYFSVDGKHSELSERYFSTDGRHSEPSERFLQPCDRHSPLFASKFIKTDINFQRYEPINILFNSKKKSYGNY